MKQQTLKRILSMTLAFLMVFSLMPMSTLAALAEENGSSYEDSGEDGMNVGGEGLVVEGTGGDCVCDQICFGVIVNEDCPVCAVDTALCEAEPMGIAPAAAVTANGGSVANITALNTALGGGHTVSGNTLTLTQDVELNTQISITSGTYIIDGDEHTITATGSSGGFFNGMLYTNDTVTLTLNDITIDGGGLATCLNLAPGTTVNVEDDVTVTNSSYCGIYFASGQEGYPVILNVKSGANLYVTENIRNGIYIDYIGTTKFTIESGGTLEVTNTKKDSGNANGYGVQVRGNSSGTYRSTFDVQDGATFNATGNEGSDIYVYGGIVKISEGTVGKITIADRGIRCAVPLLKCWNFNVTEEQETAECHRWCRINGNRRHMKMYGGSRII